VMSYSIVRVGDYDYWLERSEDKSSFPASFMNRASAELVCTLLNKEAKARIEANTTPLRITLNVKPALTPGSAVARSRPQRITLDNSYDKPKPDRGLTVSVLEERQAQPKEKTKVTI
jgi:hypothetical protein